MSTFRELKRKLANNSKQLETSNVSEVSSLQSETPQEENLFELEEARYMLNLIANSEFKGKDIQVVYNIALKLQKIVLKETT